MAKTFKIYPGMLLSIVTSVTYITGGYFAMWLVIYFVPTDNALNSLLAQFALIAIVVLVAYGILKLMLYNIRIRESAGSHNPQS